MFYLTQECRPDVVLAAHAHKVAVEAQFGVDLHIQDVYGILDNKVVFTKPQLLYEQSGVFTRT